MIKTFSSYSFGESEKIVFLLSGWKIRYYHAWIFAKILELSGFKCILYVFHDNFFTPNIEETVKNFADARDAILHDIVFQKRRGSKEFSVYGVSLGTAIAIMASEKSKDIEKIVLNLSGYDLVKTVFDWKMRISPEFYTEFQKIKISLPYLKKQWYIINPMNLIGNIRNRKILVFLSKQDDWIPYDEGVRLVNHLTKENTVRVIINKRMNHILSGVKNLLFAQEYTSFLKEN